MNIPTKTIIAAGAWLALASTTELTNIEAALVIAALVIFQTSGE
jgi:hypothetical protein